MTYIPILLVWEYLFLFLIRYSDWYAKNREFVNDIDNCIVAVSMFHFLIYVEKYSNTKIRYVFSVFCIILLQFIYYHISEETYYFIFLLLLAYPITTHII